MRRVFAAAVLAAFACSPALAQNILSPTATSTNNTSATSSGQATSNPSQSLTINGGSTPDVIQQNGFQRQRLTGTQRILSPGQTSMGLTAAGIESCSISAGLSGAFPGGSVSIGIPTKDSGCDARLDARTLWNFGLKAAAISRMCGRDEIRDSMPDVCQQYRPQPQQAGFFAVAQPVAQVAQPARLEPVERPARGQLVTVIYRGRERDCADYDGRRCLRWASR